MELCKDYDATLLCDNDKSQGFLIIDSPVYNDVFSGVFHVNEPINISYSLNNVDTKKYPMNFVDFYYRRVGEKDWVEWESINKSATWTIGFMNNSVPGNYSIVGISDGLDPSQSVLAKKQSCVPDRWPYPKTDQFFILKQPNLVKQYKDYSTKNFNLLSNEFFFCSLSHA